MRTRQARSDRARRRAGGSKNAMTLLFGKDRRHRLRLHQFWVCWMSRRSSRGEFAIKHKSSMKRIDGHENAVLGRGQNDVGKVTLKVVDEVSDIQAPLEGGESATLR